MHPHTLHATVAAHSLTQARTRLSQAIDWEHRHQRQDALTIAASASLQAWRPVIGRSSGGHGDPVGLAVLGSADAAVRPLSAGPLRRLEGRVERRLYWLTRGLSLRRVIDLLPAMGPAGAERLASWLAGLDAEIRAELELGPAREELLAGVACPACSTRLLHAQVAAPSRPVVCRAQACVCAGEGCGCGMSVLVRGLVHIWPVVPVVRVTA